ncbi:hydroxyethylthiazole kinase family protein [Hirsutella rhossiliensis]
MADPPPMTVDYSVYLVTDSRPAILAPGRRLAHVVDAALRGGATAVQLRDKLGSDADVAAQARELLGLTRARGVPLLINDRVGVALEVGCEGVHLGQDDMDVAQARRMLGPGKIIGVSARSPAEAVAACDAGADYLGIGTVFSTTTKTDTATILGPAGVGAILAALAAAGHASVPTVAIGGIDAANAPAVLAHASAPRKPLDGLAVVSAIVAAADPAAAAARLLSAVLRARVPLVVERVARATPVSHNMTNLVVQNLAANVALAVGASPIMANYALEAPDLAGLGGALVINMGTVTPEGLDNFVKALAAYNDAGRPVVLDPVGAGATAVRRDAVKKLLSAGTFAVIKGNASEMLTVHSVITADDQEHQRQPPREAQRGVDSTATLTITQRAALARSIARGRGRPCVAVVTGVSDIISDGRRTARVDNGHELLGAITGSGCSLGTVLSAAVAAYEEDPFVAAVAATVMFGVAAEMAAARSDVRGPGTFVPAFIDELHAVRRATAERDWRWLALAKVEAIQDDDAPVP